MALDDDVRPMIDWLNGVPAADLAAELMPGFGPSGAHDKDGDVIPRRLADWLFQIHGYPKARSIGVSRALDVPIAEAMQLLELAALIYVRLIADSGGRYWAATRLGLATLANGKPAVRQRIRDCTGQ